MLGISNLRRKPMKNIFLIFCSLFFSQSLFSMTLGEVGATTGIANSLQGIAQPDPRSAKALLDKTKNQVNEYKESEKKHLEQLNAVKGVENPIVENSDPRKISSLPVAKNPIVENSDPRKISSLPVAKNPIVENSDPRKISSLPVAKNPIVENSDPRKEKHSLENPIVSDPQVLDSKQKSQLEEKLKNLSEPEIERYSREEKVEIETSTPVNYKSNIQIFYKENCLSSQANCRRSHPVLTNIKSVIFDFAHARGSFSKTK